MCPEQAAVSWDWDCLVEVLGARVNPTGPVSLGKERGVCAKVNRQPLRGLELWEHDPVHPKKGQPCLRVENG